MIEQHYPPEMAGTITCWQLPNGEVFMTTSVAYFPFDVMPVIRGLTSEDLEQLIKPTCNSLKSPL